MPEAAAHVHYKVFRSSFKSWESLFLEAATFAESVGRDHLIGISHSEDENNGVVTVWYWCAQPRATR